MVATWPAELPQRFVSEDFSARSADNRIRSQVDDGVAKVRPRSSRAARPMAGSMILTTAQRLDILQPFIAALGKGSLPFWFPDPDGGDPLLVRFGEGGMPGWSHLRPGYWRVTIQLEVLP